MKNPGKEASEKTLLKSTLIKKVTEKLKDSSPKDVETAIYHMLDCMVHTLKCGGRIEIRGFGAFSVRYRPPRKARNPRTGKNVAALGKYVVYFRAGKEIKGRINPAQENSLIEEMEETCDMLA